MATGIGDILRNRVKEKLARDEVVASMTVRLVRQIEIAQIAATAGFDTLYVDLEHSSLSLETTSQICVAALGVGIAPFARVPQLGMIQQVLDGGALGIIAPDIRNAAQAREVVEAVKYPPLGERGYGTGLAQFGFRSPPATEHYRALNDATMVIVQF
ncbi:MAG: aldolase, partial [Xanthobacteraceae bacterium]|nr:aldolase [Xanthobacteraceae bacterium]